MKNNYRELWSTPIAEYWLEDMSIHEELQQHVFHKYETYQGHDTMNLFDEPCRFSNWVLECVKDYTSKFNYPLKQAAITRGWCSTQFPLHDNFIHTHYSVDIAGVYYIDTIPEHPSLEIFDPRPSHNFNMVHRKMADGNIASGFCSIQIPPERYKLLLHPGYLHHGVTHNLTNIPRSAVAMNILAKRDYSIKNITSSY
jgi:uncharacterized protein (TIGR02466 family)